MSSAMISNLLNLLIFAALSLACGCDSGGNGSWPLVTQIYQGSANQRSLNGELTIATYNIHAQANRSALREDLHRIGADIWLMQEVNLAEAPDQTNGQN